MPIIDTSDRKEHRHCLQKWDFTSHLRLGRQPIQVAPQLAFGTAIHEALDYGYARTGSYAHAAYDWMPLHFEDTSGASLPAEDRALGVAMLEEYAKWAPPLDDFEVVLTEHAGLVPIYAPRTVYKDPDYHVYVRECGGAEVYEGEVIGLYYFRTDGIVRDDRGRLWVLEHKTCKDWWTGAELALDDQITSYLWAESQWFGEPMTGVLMNFLKKEAIKDPPLLKSGLPTTDLTRLAYVTTQRYGEALMHFAGANTVGNEIVTIPKKYADTLDALAAREELKGHPTLRREKPERTPHQIRQQGERIATELLEMTRPDKPIYPTPGKHCQWCELRPLCLLREQGEDWEMVAAELTEPRQALLGLEAGV